MSYLPYLKAIKSHIQMAFPTSKITIWTENSPFYPHEIMIRTRVDNCGVYTHIDIRRSLYEEHITDVLTAEIKEVIKNKEIE